MKYLNNWTVRFNSSSSEGYCWEHKKVIDIGLKNSNPLRLLLHEIAHIGINPHGNKHTQEWLDTYIFLLEKYLPTVGLSKSDLTIIKVYKLRLPTTGTVRMENHPLPNQQADFVHSQTLCEMF